MCQMSENDESQRDYLGTKVNFIIHLKYAD